MTSDAAQWIPLFPREEIPFILAAVLRCSSRVQKQHATEHENKISNRLRKLLVRDAELRTRPVMMDREASLYNDESDDEKPIGRLDFRFLYSTGSQHPWPYFSIEAKRLHVTFPNGWKSLIAEYVTGDQGIMCFIDQRYARGLRNGAMLGYVFDGKTDDARSAIADSISANHKKLKCSSPFRLAPSVILAGDSRVSETVHLLAHGEFIVYHLFCAV